MILKPKVTYFSLSVTLFDSTTFVKIKQLNKLKSRPFWLFFFVKGKDSLWSGLEPTGRAVEKTRAKIQIDHSGKIGDPSVLRAPVIRSARVHVRAHVHTHAKAPAQ